MVQQLITQTNEEFVNAYNRGDMLAVAALYTEDAVLMPAELANTAGPAGDPRVLRRRQADGVARPDAKDSSVGGEGDTACEVGQYTLQIKRPGGELVADKGKYVVIWKQAADRSRKLAVDIWNTDEPLPA